MTLITLNNIYKMGVQVLSLGGAQNLQKLGFRNLGIWVLGRWGFGLNFFIILSFESKTEKKKKKKKKSK